MTHSAPTQSPATAATMTRRCGELRLLAKYAARGWSFDAAAASRATRGRRCSPSSCPGMAGRASTAETPRVPSPVRLRIPPAGRLRRECSALRHDCCAGDRRRRRAAEPSRTLLPVRSSSTAQRLNSQTAGAKIIHMGFARSLGGEFGREQREGGGRRERPHGRE